MTIVLDRYPVLSAAVASAVMFVVGIRPLIEEAGSSLDPTVAAAARPGQPSTEVS